MKGIKRILSVVLTLAMILANLSIPVYADTGIDYLDAKGVKQTYTGEITQVNKDMSELGSEDKSTWYYVDGTVSKSGSLVVIGDVHLILKNGSKLECPIIIASGDSLTIYAQSTGDNMGGLIAISKTQTYAGIHLQRGSKLTINGGNIKAESRYISDTTGAAGIGNSSQSKSDGFGHITINGGIITARSLSSVAAAIGAGPRYSYENNSSITINGGIINVSGGIGVRDSNSGSSNVKITITGGTITSDIGFIGFYSDNGKGVSLKVTGGNITISRFMNKGTLTAIDTGSNGNAVVYTSYEKTRGESGIFFYMKQGYVYGNPVLSSNLEVKQDETLTISEDTSLTVNDPVSLTNNGSIINYGKVIINGVEHECSYKAIDNKDGQTHTLACEKEDCPSVLKKCVHSEKHILTNDGECSKCNAVLCSKEQDTTITGENVLLYGYTDVPTVNVKYTSDYNLSYQWYEKLNDGEFVAIDGATEGTYAFAKGKTVGKYTLYCQVTTNGFSFNSSEVSINVEKAATGLNVTLDKNAFTYGENITGSITMTPEIHDVNIYQVKEGTYNADEVLTTISDVDNPIFTIGTKGLDAGDHEFIAVFEGNENMSPAYTNFVVEVKAKDIADFTLPTNLEVVYNGEQQEPAIVLTDEQLGTELVLGTDYTITYTNNIDAGEGKYTVTGIGNYTGTKEGTFTITPAPVSVNDATVELEKEYDGNINAKITNYGLIQGVVEGDDVTVASGKATYVSESVGNEIEVVFSDFVLGGKDAKNYSIVQMPNSTTANIYKKEVTALVEVEDKQYDGLDTAKISKVELDGIVEGDIVTLQQGTATFATTAVGENIVLNLIGFSIEGEDSSNYELKLPELKANIYNNFNPEVDKEYFLSHSGWSNKDFVIIASDGHLLSTTNIDEGLWTDRFTFSTEGADQSATFYIRNKETNAISLSKTETFSIDKTAPIGTVTVTENSWTEFLNAITFNMFFKETVDVKVNAGDTLSGVEKIEYIESKEALSLEEIKSTTNWIIMNSEKVSVTAEDAKQFVYYVRITDYAGNVTYLSSDGIVFDISNPVIEGINEGDTYYTTQVFDIRETNFDKVTINGSEVTEYVLAGNVEATYTIMATDKAGNSTTMTVTMKTIDSLVEIIENLTNDNVTEENKTTLNDVLGALNSIDTENASDAEKSEIQSEIDRIEALEKVIEDTKKEVEEAIKANDGIASDKVTSDDKAAIEESIKDIDELLTDANVSDAQKETLEEAKKEAQDLLDKIEEDQKALEDAYNSVPNVNVDSVTENDLDDLAASKDKLEDIINSNNYTEEEKKAAQEALDKIEELEKVIEDTKKEVEEAIKANDGIASDKVTSDDKAAIEESIKDIDELLTDANVSDVQKETLEEAKKEAQDLLDKIEEEQKALEDAYNSVPNVNADSVTENDLDDLAASKDKLEDIINSNNYTEEEKKAAQEALDKIEELEKVIEDTKKEVEEAIKANDGIASDKVTSDDKAAIEESIKDIDELLTDANVSDVQKETLEEAKKEAQDLLDKIEEEQKNLTDTLEEVKDVNDKNYSVEDKETLEETVKSLEDILTDDNYTKTEKATVQKEINRINSIIDSIEKVEDVIAMIEDVKEVLDGITNETDIPDNKEFIQGVVDAINAYENLTDKEKSFISPELKTQLDDAYAKVVKFVIILGSDGVYTKETNKDLVFTANGHYDLFVGVKVDGITLVVNSYEAVSGSTIITLKSSYLDSLEEGKHRLDVVYEVNENEYTATCEFTIEEGVINLNSGDSSNIGGWLIMMLASVLGLLFITKRRKEHEN